MKRIYFHFQSCGRVSSSSSLCSLFRLHGSSRIDKMSVRRWKESCCIWQSLRIDSNKEASLFFHTFSTLQFTFSYLKFLTLFPPLLSSFNEYCHFNGAPLTFAPPLESRSSLTWTPLSLPMDCKRSSLPPSFHPVFLLKKKKKKNDEIISSPRVTYSSFLSIFRFFFHFFFLSVLLKYFPSNFLIFIYDYFIDCIVILTVPILKVQIKGVFLLSAWSLLSKFSFFLSFPFFFLPYGSLRNAERLTFFF